MPAKKAPPAEITENAAPGPAKPVVPTTRKTAPAQAKASSPAKAVRPAKEVSKPAVKKTTSEKKKPPVPAESAKVAVHPTEAILPQASADAPAQAALTLPAETAAQTAPAQPEPVSPAPAPAAPVPPASIQPVLPPGIEKPGLVQGMAVMTMINGVLNIFWGMAAACVLTPTVCLVPFALLVVVLGICELIYASKLMSAKPERVRPSLTIAILEICCILFGNVVSMIVGILALVFYSDATVKVYFARLNSQA